MPTYFVGTSLEAFSPSLSGVYDAGDAVRIDRNYDGKITAYVTDPADGQRKGVTSLWAHASEGGAAITDRVILTMRNSAGNEVLRLLGLNDNQRVTLQRWNGSAMQDCGPPAAIGGGTIDVRVAIGAAGTVQLYFNGALAISTTGVDTSAMGDVALMQMGVLRAGVDDSY